MNRFLGLSSLGISLLALGVALWGPQGEPVAAPPPSAASAAFSAPDAKALEQRVKALEDTATSLSRRLMVLEQQRPGPGVDGNGAAGAPVSLAAEVAQLRSEVRGLTGGQSLQSEAGRQAFKEMLRSVQDEMRTEQRDQRRQQAEQFQSQLQAQHTERVRQFVSTARLSSSQEQELNRRLQGEDTQRQAVMDAVRTGEKSPQDARQEVRQLREQTDKDVKAVLDQSQQSQYDEMRRQDFHQARGGWPGAGRGGAGPGLGDMP